MEHLVLLILSNVYIILYYNLHSVPKVSKIDYSIDLKLFTKFFTKDLLSYKKKALDSWDTAEPRHKFLP